MEGTILDKYEVLDKVGEGGMASVYRARHTTLGREVAIKILHPHLSNAERNRLRFEREAQAIESLRHDNIVEIYDYSGPTSEHCYIVTEFIHGFTLKSFLAEHTLPSEMAASVGAALCDALAYAHRQGIVHRDIKPENVMIRPDGRVKLMDFGIARVLDDSKVTMTGGLVGSPAYMSPEQASDAKVGRKSDQFSLGILLYRAVTGHLPFTGGNPPIILRNILDGNYPHPEDVTPDIDPFLADTIVRALAPTPEGRFEDADAMGAALRSELQRAGIDTSEAERARYFADPNAYLAWLSAHLRLTLLPAARAMIDAGDTAQGMRLLNRLLFIDEDNDEVRALLLSLHPAPRRLSRALIPPLLVLVIPALVGLWLVFGPSGPAPLTSPAPGADAVVTPPPRPQTPPSPTAAPTTAPSPRPVARATQAPAAKRTPRPQRPPPRRPETQVASRPPQPPGILDLTSDPWARITIDGQSKDARGVPYGNTLPTKPITLPAGTYTLRLTNPRCAPLEAQITITSGSVTRRRFNLCARLTIQGLEGDDHVLINNRRVGQAGTMRWPVVLTIPPEEAVIEVRRGEGIVFTTTLNDIAHHDEIVLDANTAGGS